VDVTIVPVDQGSYRVPSVQELIVFTVFM